MLAAMVKFEQAYVEQLKYILQVPPGQEVDGEAFREVAFDYTCAAHRFYFIPRLLWSLRLTSDSVLCKLFQRCEAGNPHKRIDEQRQVLAPHALKRGAALAPSLGRCAARGRGTSRLPLESLRGFRGCDAQAHARRCANASGSYFRTVLSSPASHTPTSFDTRN